MSKSSFCHNLVQGEINEGLTWTGVIKLDEELGVSDVYCSHGYISYPCKITE